MATTFRCFLSIIFLTLVIKGSCDCSLSNLVIGTTRSGREIQGKAEWNVIVENHCSCAQSNIILDCRGFQSVEKVNPLIFSVRGDKCIVNNGNPLRGFGSVKFSYAWDPPFILMPNSSVVRC